MLAGAESPPQRRAYREQEPAPPPLPLTLALMGEYDVIREVETSVAANPDDPDRRRELVELLIVAGEYDQALDHLDELRAQLPKTIWPVRLAIAVAVADGNHLLAARLRTDLRALDPTKNNGSSGQAEGQDRSHSASTHPSRGAQMVRRLQLIVGGSTDAQTPDSPETRIDDVAGIRTIRRNLRALLDEIHDQPQSPDNAWLGGLLLYGPAHCGKSFAAELIAGELDAPLWTFNLTHHWRNLAEQVERALDEAAKHPALVLYFTDIDLPDAPRLLQSVLPLLDRTSTYSAAASLSATPASPTSSASASSLSSASVSPTSPTSPVSPTRSRVVILGSATAPWAVSPDILRHGRFGRVLLVLPPDQPARTHYLTETYRGKATISTDDIEWAARRTEGFSFHDLDQLVTASVAYARDADESSVTIPLVNAAALRHARAQISPTSANWLTTAAQHALVTPESGLYDDLIAYLKARQHV